MFGSASEDIGANNHIAYPPSGHHEEAPDVLKFVRPLSSLPIFRERCRWRKSMIGHKAKSCMLFIVLQLFSWQIKTSLAHSAAMSSNDQDQNENQISSNDEPPYTITHQDGKLNVVFTSGDMKGQDFQIDLSKIPPPIDDGQPRQLEEEPSQPYSVLAIACWLEVEEGGAK